MTATPAPARKLDGTEKLLVELGPLLLFFAGLFFHTRLAPVIDGLLGTGYFDRPGRELYLGLALFCPAFAGAFVYSLWKTRRAAPMLIVVAVITSITAVFTFLFDNKEFTYMKPTMIYGLSAALLGGGLLAGRNFLKVIFDGAFEMPDTAWRTLTWRFVAFNALAAAANEVAWRTLTADCVADMPCSGEKTWFTIKAFGFTAAYIGFVLANTPFMMKHIEMPDPKDGDDTPPPASPDAS